MGYGSRVNIERLRTRPTDFVLPVVYEANDVGFLRSARFFPTQNPTNHLRHQYRRGSWSREEDSLRLWQIHAFGQDHHIDENAQITFPETTDQSFYQHELKKFY